MFRTLMHHYVFVIESAGYYPHTDYDTFVTSFADIRESNARYKAWEEAKLKWDLKERVKGQWSNEHGRAILVHCYMTEPGAYHKLVV